MFSSKFFRFLWPGSKNERITHGDSNASANFISHPNPTEWLLPNIFAKYSILELAEQAIRMILITMSKNRNRLNRSQ
tara:strand:+ start:236 stop:466 length:231 start_codon:yes stop_codon:yes gene_type:complete